MAERRPGNRATANAPPSGRPGNRLPAVAPTAQVLSVQASVASAKVEQASVDSVGLEELDIGVAVQAYNTKLASLSDGALVTQTRTISASGAVAASDQVILANAAGGAITLTLPAAATSAGRRLSIKKTDASANAVTIDGNGAETIDGALTYSLTAQYQSVELLCAAGAWQMV